MSLIPGVQCPAAVAGLDPKEVAVHRAVGFVGQGQRKFAVVHLYLGCRNVCYQNFDDVTLPDSPETKRNETKRTETAQRWLARYGSVSF